MSIGPAIAALFALRSPDGFRFGGYVARIPRTYGHLGFEFQGRELTVVFEPPVQVDPDRIGFRDRDDLADGHLLRIKVEEGASRGTAYVEKKIPVFGKSVEAIEFEVTA